MASNTTNINSLDALTLLPTRGETRIIPVPTDNTFIPSAIHGAAGIPEGYNLRQNVDLTDFYLTKAKTTLTDYITIRINERKNDNGEPYTYRFIINPETLSINRTTVDGQSMARGGWQFGVWGEDLIRISGKGTTAGQYFADTLVDGLGEYTMSYRNIQALVVLFQNNGYWFEGESKNDNGPLAADFLRKKIKKHSDVIFTADNFIWHGMFQSLTLVESADAPFFNTFSFDFVAWRERYRSGSSWVDSFHSDRYSGHYADIFGRKAQEQSQDRTVTKEQVANPAPANPTPVDTTPFADRLVMPPSTSLVSDMLKKDYFGGFGK